MDTSVEEKPKLEPLPQRNKSQNENGNDTKPFNQHNRGQNQQNRGQNQQKRGFGGPRRNNDNNDQRGPNQRNPRDGRNNEVSYNMAAKISYV